MARANWDTCERLVRSHEGGNDDDPRDPGGRTSRGIIQREWTQYVATHQDERLPIDVWKAPDSAISDIYRTKYWLKLRCDELPAGVDYSVFDYGVNSGISRSGKVLRRVVGLPDSTGAVTEEVLAAVARRDSNAVVHAINIERLVFLKGLRTWPVFGRGWARRVDEVNSASLQMADRNGPSTRGVGSSSPVLQLAPVPGKGVVPAPAGVRKLIVASGAAAPVAAGGGFAGWIVAHPVESAALGCGVALLVGGSLAALSSWQQRRQDAGTAATSVVPELVNP
ncbi:glycoside hydrolase family 108 protein [Bradyrhizobium sp. HKCCYLS2038]|uniref:glycoside hydrolase family 108 protein n=1 Tax=unclassified Bradyrhizobium TaxID=2631580 RepID=UPI003EBB80C8